jgi:hypothetical protein
MVDNVCAWETGRAGVARTVWVSAGATRALARCALRPLRESLGFASAIHTC